MAANAPQGGSSEAVSQVTHQPDHETKPTIAKEDPQFVNLQIFYQQDGSRTTFRVRRNTPLSQKKRNTPLQKLLISFCTHRSLDMKALRVLFEGTRVNLERTPRELQMEDGDEIEAMIEATGGSRVA